MPNVPPTPVPMTPPGSLSICTFFSFGFFFFFLLLLFLELLAPGAWSMWRLLHVGWLREWGHSRAPPPHGMTCLGLASWHWVLQDFPCPPCEAF